MWVTQHHQLKTYQIWFLVYDTMLAAFHYCMTSRHCVLAPSTGIISTRVATDILSNVIPECPGFILGGLINEEYSELQLSDLNLDPICDSLNLDPESAPHDSGSLPQCPSCTFLSAVF